VPTAEPVERFVQASIVECIAPEIGQFAPGFAIAVSAPHVPLIAVARRSSQAEPVMMRVHLHAAAAWLHASRSEAAPALPAVPGLAFELGTAPAASLPAPEAAEIPVAPAKAISRLHSLPAAPRLPLVAAIPAIQREVALQLAPASVVPAAAPLERLLVASSAHRMAVPKEPCMQPFALQSKPINRSPGFDAPRLAPAASIPPSAVAGSIAARPFREIDAAAALESAPSRIGFALPEPGLLPMEYHSHRLRSAPFSQPEWMSVQFVPVPPRFALAAAFDKAPEVATAPKPIDLDSEASNILNMPASKAEPSAVLLAFKIAAAILLAVTLWFGVGAMRGNRTDVARQDGAAGSAVSPADSVAVAETAPEAVTQPAPKGFFASIRHSLAERASLQITDNFRGSMANWAPRGAKSPEGWSHHAEGYIQSGALALFHPSLKFTDYHLDFFGQIEQKSLGWTVRAKDEKNYHAMKVSVVEAGLRPFVALVQYDVIDGKPGQRFQTPLTVMVHNNRPMQVAVDVVGNRFVTSIDGEEVDTFNDGALASGGVGFFSDAGEHARLYWMRVSRNDDWLGHVCAFLSGGSDGVRTATRRDDLGTPGGPCPGEAPAGTLAALGLLPGRGIIARRRHLRSWRNRSWNA
jgi:hypothetical protein